MNYLQIAYELGVKQACADSGVSFEDFQKWAGVPPPIPMAAKIRQAIPQAVSHTGKVMPSPATPFRSAFTPDVLARLGGGI